MTDDQALDDFAALLAPEGQALLWELRDHDPADELAAATRLRRDHAAPLVSAALTQARLRQRAAVKFGADAQRMYFTPNGVEQSTRASVAAHRAARLAGLGVRTLADLCCGIGGDALALARAGIRVLAVDRDALACAAARANAEALGLAELIEVRCADVTEVDTTGYDAVFVDPARRTKARGGRIFDPEAYSPPLSWAVEAARTAPFAALKIAPGVPHEALPEDAETEWISYGGEVKEAVVWFARPGGGEKPVPGGGDEPVPGREDEPVPGGGDEPVPGREDEPAAGGGGKPVHRGGDAPVAGGRRATLLPGGDSLLGAGLPDPEPGPVGRYLYEPDGAVIRAHLVAEVAAGLDGRLIDPTIAYVTADALRPTPFATAYAITDVLPFNVKRLKALLREREVGVAVIKKRGSAVEPEELRKKLKLGGGGNSCTIFLTRVAGAPTMLLGQPANGF
ncbi:MULTISPECIES: class I SAM-dependent methyltransferase [Streptomyces]|uniref:Class I SAM-dependent methyltransferase n=1 Tax=Streptomyces siderophoricus TaxID=2802281 RepID=A0ABS1MQU0_9ACTN|nr:class I SAM-dependent methyltransferase [Streptomyces sp. 9-7]MBL1090155.1 class I SAM-dependent methyltransferase [Streptomyces sp. 9-7]